MSINVSYKSFSPSRADQRWDAEGASIAQSLVDCYTKVSLTWEENDVIKQEVAKVFEERSNNFLCFLRSKFRGTSMDYQWDNLVETYEFLSEEEKREYDSLFSDKKKLFDEKTEYALAQKRAESRPKFLKTKDLLWDFLNQDLEFGSIENEVFAGAVLIEETWIEDLCVRVLCEVFALPTKDDAPTKDGWLQLYNHLDQEKLVKCIQKLAYEAGVDIATAKEFMVSYLKEVKPVVQDLKVTQDASFYRDWGDIDVSNPMLIERTLIERAEMLLKRYKNLLPNLV